MLCMQPPYGHVFSEAKQKEMRRFFSKIMAPLGIVRHYEKNQIVDVPESGQCFGVVVSGKISKAIVSSNGKEKMLYFLRVGEIFGEMDLIDGGGINFILRAKEPTSISFIPAEKVQMHLQAHPEAYRHFIHSITRKYRIMALQVANNAFNDSKGRIAEALIRLAACADTEDADMVDGMITTAFTHSELAYNVGCSRVTVSRVLADFFEEGLLERVSGKIVLKDREGLARYTDRIV